MTLEVDDDFSTSIFFVEACMFPPEPELALLPPDEALLAELMAWNLKQKVILQPLIGSLPSASIQKPFF